MSWLEVVEEIKQYHIREMDYVQHYGYFDEYVVHKNELDKLSDITFDKWHSSLDLNLED